MKPDKTMDRVLTSDVAAHVVLTAMRGLPERAQLHVLANMLSDFYRAGHEAGLQEGEKLSERKSRQKTPSSA